MEPASKKRGEIEGPEEHCPAATRDAHGGAGGFDHERNGHRSEGPCSAYASEVLKELFHSNHGVEDAHGEKHGVTRAARHMARYAAARQAMSTAKTRMGVR